MNTWCILVFGLFSLLPSVHAASAGYEQALAGWSQGDGKAVSSIKDAAYAEFAPNELKTLLPQIWKWIPMQEVLAGHDGKVWQSFHSNDQRTQFHNSLPVENAFRKQYDLGMRAAELIRFLSEKRLITDQGVLPVLVDGLEAPEYYTYQSCFVALGLLTKLYDGPLTSDAYLDGDKDRQVLADWFKTWLNVNRSKQLILTTVWEEKLKSHLLDVCRRVETLSTATGHPLNGFKAPEERLYHKVGEPVFDVLWSGEMLARRPISSTGGGWLYICVRTQTPLLHGIKGWERFPWDVPATLPTGAKRVLKELIDGTDWMLEIYTKDLDPEAVKEVAELIGK